MINDGCAGRLAWSIRGRRGEWDRPAGKAWSTVGPRTIACVARNNPLPLGRRIAGRQVELKGFSRAGRYAG
jgi:hypothetical protein